MAGEGLTEDNGVVFVTGLATGTFVACFAPSINGNAVFCCGGMLVAGDFPTGEAGLIEPSGEGRAGGFATGAFAACFAASFKGDAGFCCGGTGVIGKIKIFFMKYYLSTISQKKRMIVAQPLLS